LNSPLIVSAVDLHRRYGEGDAAVDALDGVTVGFPKGRFTAIMGPSGSGKSTLMHILAGLDRPTGGSVVVDGVELADLDDKKLTQLRRDKFGFIFQFFNLLPVLTAEENITLPLKIAGKKPEKEWLDELIDAVGLGDRRTHRPSQLSGGQQQRIAIARAVLADPDLVMFDEATSSLDTFTERAIQKSMEKLSATRTVLVVAHRLSTIRKADKVIVVENGRIVEEGTHRELLAQRGRFWEMVEHQRLDLVVEDAEQAVREARA
jgi:putative ABC transport system ATP-binding protein